MINQVLANVTATAGLVFITYAGAQVHTALGWLVAGVELVALGVAIALYAAREKRKAADTT